MPPSTLTEAIMNLGALRSRIRQISLVETDDFSDTDLNDLINESIATISLDQNWPWVQKLATVTTVASQQAYTLPTDFVRHMMLAKSTGVVVATTVEDATYKYTTTPAESDNAEQFYLFGETLYLLPIPSTTGTVYNLYYISTPTALALDADTPPWISAYHDIIVDHVLITLWEQQEYFSEADRSYAKYLIKLDKMRRHYNSQLDSNRWVMNGGI